MHRHFFSKVAVLQVGSEPLPCCNMSVMHMPAGRLIKYRRMARCFNNTEMRIRFRDIDVVIRCSGVEFRLTREEGEETIEVLALFKYLGRTLENSKDEWPLVRQNIRKARQVWGRIGVILRREGSEPYHFCAFLQSGGIVGAPILDGDVGLVRGHGEADIVGPHGFFVVGDG